MIYPHTHYVRYLHTQKAKDEPMLSKKTIKSVITKFMKKLPMFSAHRNQFNILFYDSPNWFLYNTNIGYYFVKENINSMFIKSEVFKNGSRKICKRQPLPMFKQPTHLKKCLSLILFGPFSETLSYIESGGYL